FVNNVAGLFAERDMQYARHRPTDEPDLMLMTRKAIEILEKSGKEYFLMVEGSLIDIAQHANSMHGAFDEMREFESAIKEVSCESAPSNSVSIKVLSGPSDDRSQRDADFSHS
ncbi:Alkaline phosphatase placental type, partial [Trichostrongylus colubriformis]